MEKMHYGGTRGKVEVMRDHLSVVFNIRSPQMVVSIQKALGRWIPTSTKFHWETAKKNEMHTSSKGMYIHTFKFDGEYALNLPKEALPEVVKAVGWRQRTAAQLDQLAINRSKRPLTIEEAK
jgi:hypothetical protein